MCSVCVLCVQLLHRSKEMTDSSVALKRPIATTWIMYGQRKQPDSGGTNRMPGNSLVQVRKEGRKEVLM